MLGIAVLTFIVPPVSADLFPASGPVVSGKTARFVFGRAAAPKNAPLAVKRAIWAANQLPQNRTGTAVVTNHLMIAATIVPVRFPMRSAPRD